MTTKASVLLAHDDPGTVAELKKALANLSDIIEIDESKDISDTLGALSAKSFDLLIVDYYHGTMPGKKLLNAMEELEKSELPKSVLAIADLIDRDYLDVDIENLNYIGKGFKPRELSLVTANILHIKPPKEKTIDSGFIIPFVNATRDVLKIMCFTDSEKEHLGFTANEQVHDVSTLVSLVSPHFYGSLTITFDRSCFLGICSRMLGEDYKEISNDLLDAAAEICNQVLGQAKSKLNEAGYGIEMAIPMVVNGRIATPNANGRVTSVRFKTDVGFFVVETTIHV